MCWMPSLYLYYIEKKWYTLLVVFLIFLLSHYWDLNLQTSISLYCVYTMCILWIWQINLTWLESGTWFRRTWRRLRLHVKCELVQQLSQQHLSWKPTQTTCNKAPASSHDDQIKKTLHEQNSDHKRSKEHTRPNECHKMSYYHFF